MANLLEVEYEDIFRPETMAVLKGKSGKSLKQMLGNKSLMQTMVDTQKILGEIIAAERGYTDLLEAIAVEIATEAYPIIDYANIKINAKIGKPSMPNMPEEDDEEEEEELTFDQPEIPETPEVEKAKRRIINGITQGASVRGAFIFLLFREHLDEMDDTLVEKYNEISKQVFGIYDDETAIAMLLTAIEQGMDSASGEMKGGESEIEWDEGNKQFVINAYALCFPMLVHEIIKGLYEIVGTEGFGPDKAKNQAIVNAVDKISNEPNDFRFGKFIYDAITKLYNESNLDDARIRELFFSSLYKLEDNKFISFVENAINDTLTPEQKRWALGEMKDIEKDLKKDDTGLSDLGEGLLNEVKAEHISVGDIFTLSADLGKFKKGNKVRVTSVKPSANDVVITLSSGTTKDTFYLDKGDEFEGLDENENNDAEESDEPAPTPSTPPGEISTEEAKRLIKDTKGKIFTATFTKKDGTERVMNARLGVKKYLKGGSLAYDAESKGLIPVYDMQLKGYRTINVNTISKLKIGKNTYDVSNNLDEARGRKSLPSDVKEEFHLYRIEIPNIGSYYRIANYNSRTPEIFKRNLINSSKATESKESDRTINKNVRDSRGNFDVTLVGSNVDKSVLQKLAKQKASEDNMYAGELGRLGAQKGTSSTQPISVSKADVKKIGNDYYVSELAVLKNKDLKQRINPKSTINIKNVKYVKLNNINSIKTI
jgi:hypothetical protein